MTVSAPASRSKARVAAGTVAHSRRRWLAAGGAVVIAGIAALAFVNGGGSGQTTTVRVSGAPAGAVGTAAPSFSAPTVAGVAFASPTHRPTLLYFMAGWCGTCVPEAKALASLQPGVKDRADLVAVDADPSDSWASLNSFAQGVGSPDYAFAKDDGQISGAFGVKSLDTTIVLDAAGRVVYRNIGALDEAGLRAALARAGVSA